MANFKGGSLNDVLSGSGLSDWIAGLAGNDTLTGNAGADTLDGGAGTDSLAGGAGNDTYVIDNVGDKISESSGTDDRILASISIDLAAYPGVEHVTLTGSTALNATGNGSANMLVGNDGANHLDGKAGADTMIGGVGNDIYEVDNVSDLVIELPNGGIDQVNSSVNIVLGVTDIENLTLTGVNSITALANGLANKITANTAGDDISARDGNDTLLGNIGNDTLNGQAGADSMVGGIGNDRYLVDDVADEVMENGPSTDVDEVQSTITYSLGANLENLTLAGSDAIDGTGNGLNNSIVGNDNDNILSGLGGADIIQGGDGSDLMLGGDGNDTLVAGVNFDFDTLVGGAGNDVFQFVSPNGANTIADLNGLPGGDSIDITGVLKGFVAGVSNVNDFLKTTTAAGSTAIQVDADGTANGVAFVGLVTLQGVSTDLAGLLANGTIAGVGATALVPLDGTAAADSKAGGGSSDLIRGLAGNDTLTGNAGADTLDGGAGADSLVGGAGNDTYVVDNAGDKISDSGGDKDDRILASIGIDLTANAAIYAGVEHVTLTGTSALNATGDGSANMLIGNSGANHLDGKAGADTMIGADGNDIYEVDNASDQVIELANGGIDQVNSSVSILLSGGAANVENLTLTGTGAIAGTGNELANTITGNAADNTLGGSGGNDTLTGNDGDDRLDGGKGADSMAGGDGNDTYSVDNAGDKVTESGPATDTADTVQSTIAYTLGANVENLTLFGLGSGTGNSLNNTILGSSFDNVLSGLAGADAMNGNLGNDLLLGGDGNDTLVAAQGSDTLVGGAGTDDFVFVSGSLDGVDTLLGFDGLPGGDKIDVSALLVGFQPGVSNINDFLKTAAVDGSTLIQVDKDGTANGVAFVDMVSLLGLSTDLPGLTNNGTIAGVGTTAVAPIDGTAAADSKASGGNSDLLRGFAGSDTLSGNGGSDTLDGGAGNDSLVGGAGNDAYVIDSVGDKIDESGGGADDRIVASISIDLTANAVAYAGIEHVTLTGTSALNATGNGANNMLIGNGGANILDGGAGNDTLVGGAGNDTYKVDSADDVVIELPGEGVDTVISTATAFALGDADIENLTLVGNAPSLGAGNDLANKITGGVPENDLRGLGGNDTLTGNVGEDTLDGGTGADSMVGGAGNDVYIVDDVGDVVTESATGGGDTVQSSIAYTLGATLERLFLVGVASIAGTGNGLDNQITGNFGDNVLSGLAGDDRLTGGDGNDVLLGGAGNDILNLDKGSDTAVGGAGGDVFRLGSPGPDGPHVVADFTGGPGGDVIDLQNLLVGFDFATDNINDFLKSSTAKGSTTIQADVDGTANGVAFVNLVTLQGVSTDIAGLLTTGSLLLPSNAAAETLDGGTKTDSLFGGTGNDTYVIDSIGDKISDPGGANDRILASINFDLAAYAGIEHATLTGSAALSAAGNSGANMLIGNGAANLLDGKAGADTMIGGDGNDIYAVDSVLDKVFELATGGIDQVNSSADITLGAGIENVTLLGAATNATGNDLANKITANAANSIDILNGLGGDDTLIGNGANGVLDGGTGADSMVGGAGDDFYLVDDAGDKVVESGPSTDSDEVDSSVTFTLGANIEQLFLLNGAKIDGTGNSLNNEIQGNDQDNVLGGLAGDDALEGRGGNDLLLGGDGNNSLSADEGNDTMVGGAGNDAFDLFTLSLGGLDTIADLNGLPGGDVINLTTLLNGFVPGVSNVGDFLKTTTANGNTLMQIDANGTAGGVSFVDLVSLQGVSTDLAGLLANGVIVGNGALLAFATAPIQGTTGADSKVGTGVSDLMLGLAGNDTLTGNAGADTLDGGAGADSLVGGAGNDTYVIDNAGDKISDTGGDKDDRILASIGIDLTANAAIYAGVEHVTLTGTSALNATGDGSANMLIGNSGANHLDGKAGADTMIGADGNDIYEVDNTSDQVIELANGGIDQVNSSADFTLGANIENLTLTGAAIAGTGNDLANKITGNAAGNDLSGDAGNDSLTGNDGADTLDGGTGADSMAGGAGNDFYRVDDLGDTVAESGPSTDRDNVRSTITYTLGANLENLTLAGSAEIDGTGNSLNNFFLGNSANNVLSGLAGDDIIAGLAGDDLMLGGEGNDAIEADEGVDTLVGGAGKDLFQFFDDTFDGVDTIGDLNALPGGDTMRIDLLTGFVPGVSNVNQFLKATTANGSTLIQVDIDGAANGVAFVDMVVLQGVSTDIAGLLANGVLEQDANLLAPSTAPIQGTAGIDNKAGTSVSDLMLGLAGNDTLIGNAGADTLDGGAGKDSLVGGAGNDTYVIDSTGDAISETGGDLDDRILASISIDLTANAIAFAGIEHVTLIGTSALNATGNGVANMLIGNDGANILDGAAGNDTLIGGAGNDTYKVDSTTDVVVELPGGGTDTVLSTATAFTLGADIENLTLTGNAFATGTGNDLANKLMDSAAGGHLFGVDGNDTLIGNTGNDTLDGGAGIDSMVGGAGNDFYIVDNIGDKVTESGPSTDKDEVDSAITYTIGATIEQLRLTGIENIDGTGNALDNFMNGNGGDNVLSGLAGNDSLFGNVGSDLLLGGDGNDLLASGNIETMVGGAGSDTFRFDFVFGADVITDFTGGPGGDLLDLHILLSGFDFASDNINDFLKTSTANGSTTIQADVDGTANGVNFVDFVQLQGVSTDLAGLVTNGNVILE